MNQINNRTNFILDGINNSWDKIKATVFIDREKFPEKGQRFTAIYSRDREYLYVPIKLSIRFAILVFYRFDVNSRCFFTPAIHSRIVQFILDRKRFSENQHDDFAFGIERLLNEKVYTAVYPLHDVKIVLYLKK